MFVNTAVYRELRNLLAITHVFWKGRHRNMEPQSYLEQISSN